MTATWRTLALAGVLTIGPAGMAPAQVTYATPPGGTIVVSPSVPLAPGGTYYAAPERRTFRQRARYYTMRPGYGGRPALTFEPYSRYYLNDGRFAARRAVVPQVYVPAYPR